MHGRHLAPGTGSGQVGWGAAVAVGRGGALHCCRAVRRTAEAPATSTKQTGTRALDFVWSTSCSPAAAADPPVTSSSVFSSHDASGQLLPLD